MECEFFDSAFISVYVENNQVLIGLCKCCNMYCWPTKKYTLEEWNTIEDKVAEIQNYHNVYPNTKCPIRKDAGDIKYRGGSKLKNNICYSDNKYPLHTINIALDTRCNNRCSFCFCHPARDEFNKLPKEIKDKTINAYFSLMNDFRGKVWGLQVSSLGEPFYDEEAISDFLLSLTRKDFDYIIINSNMINVEEKAIEALKHLREENIGVHFNASVNAYDRVSYLNKMKTNNFDRVIRNVTNLYNNVSDMHFSISYVLERNENPLKYFKTLRLLKGVKKTYVYNNNLSEKSLTFFQKLTLRILNYYSSRSSIK